MVTRPGLRAVERGERPVVTVPDSVTALRDAIIAETADQDDTIRAMAVRLAELTAVAGPAGVAAARALAELVSSVRDA